MKVTLISSLPPQKGISAYTLHLVNALAALSDLELEVLAFRSLYPRFLYPGGTVEDAGMQAEIPPAVHRREILTWYDPSSWVRAGLAARGDLVHAQWWSYPLAPMYRVVLSLARRRGKKVVLTLHNVLPHEQGRAKRWLNAMVFSLADHVIVHSAAMKDGLLRAGRFKEPQVSVIPHGILTPPAAGNTSPAEARAELDLPAEAQVVLYFGNIRPYKGVDTLLEAFQIISQKLPEAVLLIAGQPWMDWKPYQARIASLGIGSRVKTRLGFVPFDRVHLFFAAADVVALPYTHFDAQSGVAAMALASSRPTVVTDVGGLPDMVPDPRLIVPAGDPPALADAVCRVLADPVLRRELSEKTAVAAQAFSWDRIAAQTAEVYRALLDTCTEPD